jgi:ankyrin repeat protein
VNAAKTDDGATALMAASRKGHLEVVHELCQRGANVNAAMNYVGVTALMIASRFGLLPIVQCLLDHGASKTAVCLSRQNAYDFAAGDDIAALRAVLKP